MDGTFENVDGANVDIWQAKILLFAFVSVFLVSHVSWAQSCCLVKKRANSAMVDLLSDC